ncbi:MAG: energy transducer TonB [Alphaproteobacteria bacterium]
MQATASPQVTAQPVYDERIIGFRLRIGADGRVKGCRITRSSGDKKIDSAACKVLTARSRFKPARDNYGNAIEDTYEGKVKWRVEGDAEPPPSTTQCTSRLCVSLFEARLKRGSGVFRRNSRSAA